MNDSLRDAAFRAGVWSVIEAKAKAMKDQAKAELSALEPGDAVSGKWHGQPVAKATMTKGRDRFVIDDDELFLAWVKEYHPDEIVESVRSSFIESLKIASKDLTVPIDRDGVVVDGVVWEQGSPYISVRKADGAEDVIAELFRSGAVGLDGITPAALPPVVDVAHLDSMPSNRWTEDMEAGAIG